MSWSEKYKESIDCDNPKGFSQRAHCQGRKKKIIEQLKSYKTVEEIAKKHRLEVSFIQRQLDMGEPIEHEHTKNHELAREIALQHLDEIPDYYTRLKKMEAQAKKHHKKFKDIKESILESKRDNKRASDPGYSLRDWFAGGGWVQAGGKYDGKPCAKQPGQKTKPFCRDADDRAAMSKEERNKRAKKKRKEDPNPNRKGKARIVTAEAVDATPYGGPDELLRMLVPKSDKKKIIPSTPQKPVNLDKAHFEPEGEMVEQMANDPKTNPGLGQYVQPSNTAIKYLKKPVKGMKVGTTSNKGISYSMGSANPDEVYEEKDACYKKVKSRYKVWPSAYASGALVKCRKVGADNWGTKSEQVNMERYCPKCKKNEMRDECKYGPKYWDTYSLPINLSSVAMSNPHYHANSPHPANEQKDHEYSMARSEISTIISAAKRLKKKMGKGEGSLEAWVQSKITKAADYLDSAADYIESGEHDIEEAKKCWPGYKKKGTQELFGKKYNRCVKEGYSNWREELGLTEDWQKVNRQDKTDGLSQAAVDAYRRENPGSKLQTAVTEKKPTGKRAKRRANFCRRMKGMKSKLTSAKTARDPDSRINKALRRWNCN